jgi:predicted ATPase/DNA-binding XRE family transcriptional regulator
MQDNLTFGAWLKRRRRGLGLTQQELARRVGYAEITVRKVEADNLRPSREMAEKLAHHLQIEPEHREQFIRLARDEADWEDASLPTHSPPLALHNIPSAIFSLIGREEEQQMLETFLMDPALRLITITGAGGMGKTRLALAVAERQVQIRDRFQDGVFFISLAPVSSAEQIVPTMASVLAFPLQGQDRRSPRQQLIDYLRSKRMLLLLDNFEHLLDGGDLVMAILQAAPGVQILVTSREPLRLRGEQLLPLQGLALPNAPTDEAPTASQNGYPAATLFVETARRIQPHFRPDHNESSQIARICRVVQGMPLALELAAAWVDTLALPHIAAEVERSLDLLETDFRDVPARHRSMRAVFDASWARLSDQEQQVFSALSVFRGGFTLEAAEAVAAASLSILSRLIKQSLLQYDPSQVRYQIHELLRQYGAEKLTLEGEERAIRRRHSVYYCAWMHTRALDLQGAQQQIALVDIETESGNVQAAWQWATARRLLDPMQQAMDGIGAFYERQGRYAEGETACQVAVQALQEIPSLEARRLLVKAQTWQSLFLRIQGHTEPAHDLLQKSLDLLQHPDLADQDIRSERAFLLLQMGHLAMNRDFESARSAYEKSLALYRALDARWESALALVSLGQAYHCLGDYASVQKCYAESLPIYRDMGDLTGMAATLEALSMNARFQGRFKDAEQLALESHLLCQQIGSQSSIAEGLYSLAQALDWNGRHEKAHALMQQSIDLFTELGNRNRLAVLYPRLSMTQNKLGLV